MRDWIHCTCGFEVYRGLDCMFCGRAAADIEEAAVVLQLVDVDRSVA